MELMDAIYTRRSIRRYLAKPVDQKIVLTILGAAMMAPSAGNEQPWQFIVVTDEIQRMRVKDVHPYAGMAPKAPLGILVCGDLDLAKFPELWVQDCSAAMQNLLLAAHDQGLGAVWTGIYPIEERIEGFRRIFNLPPKVVPFGYAVIGWPDQKSTRKDRFKADRVHLNTWQG